VGRDEAVFGFAPHSAGVVHNLGGQAAMWGWLAQKRSHWWL
jgi:hypothetical protein